ncbi:MAG: hypothetical protein JSW51_01345, partial [Gemmatimonadota bacterium]
MEAAGRSVAHIIGREFGPTLSHGVMVVAGHGNNGGDGWVVARALNALGIAVHAVDEDRERSPDCEANRTLALSEGVNRVSLTDNWPAVGVLVD